MTPEQIIREVAAVTRLLPAQITGPRRTNRICRARFLAIAAIRHAFPRFTLKDIADAIGRKDHCTISHAERAHRKLMKKDPSYVEDAKAVVRRLFVKPQSS